MIWQNLWALAGLSLLVLPVLIHLLSRKRAVVQQFPTLRFLNVSRLLPTRSPNLSDIPLLLVRLAIVAAAVLALAQPLWLSATRKQSRNATLARVIVVDTSRSMLVGTANGKTAVDSARTFATNLANDASTSVVLQTASPATALAGADAWLLTQNGRGDVVVISDFQTGAIDSAAFASISTRFGVRTIRLGSVPNSNAGIVLHTARTNVTAVADSGRISADWTPANSGGSSVALVSTSADRSIVEAARDAANTVTSPSPPDSAKPTAIVFPGASETSAVQLSAKAPDAAWMAQAMLRVSENELLISSVANETTSDTTIAAPFAAIVRNQSGAPVVYAAQGTVNGATHLTFFQRSSSSSLSSAALIAAVSSSVGVASDLAESETTSLSDDALQRLERAPQDIDVGIAESAASASAGMSDGRWLWMLVLVLLGLETLVRRKSRDSALPERA